MNGYVLLYPSYFSNALQFESLSTNNIQKPYGIAQFEDSPAGDTDESTEGAEESFEEGGDADADGDSDGDGDGDEDVGEETFTDFWQSLIDYFGICEGNRNTFHIAALPQIKANRLWAKTN